MGIFHFPAWGLSLPPLNSPFLFGQRPPEVSIFSLLIYWKRRPLRPPGSLCHLKPAHPDRPDLTLLRCSWSFAGQKKTLLYIWCIFTSKHGSSQHLPQTHLHHLQHLLRGEFTRLITVKNGRLWCTRELFGNKKCVVEVCVRPLRRRSRLLF